MVVSDRLEMVAAKPAVGAFAKLADPGPLGLASFAATTFLLSAVNAKLLDSSVETVVFGLAFFYGGIAQLLAGMWEFAKGNTFGAVAFTSYGAFWLSFWYLLNHLPAKPASATDLDHAIGAYLLVWTIFTACMLVASVRTTGVIMAVFSLLTLTFLFLCVGAFAANDNLTRLGGWLGLLTALLAWYGALAGVANATAERVVFPVFPRS